MDIALLILSIIGVIFIIVIMTIISEDKFFILSCSIILTFFSIATGGMIEFFTSIDPIEVYRGNTKLEITEKRVDGQIVEKDSIVILKDK